MTHQRDPDRRTGMRNPMQRADGSWSVLPIILGVLFLIVLGFMFMGDRTTGPGTSTTTSVDRTTPGGPGGPTKTTPTQPK